MTDKVQKIREEVERRVKFHAESSDPLVSAYVSEDNAIISFIDSLQEEPVSEDLEIAANEWDAKASFTPFYMALDDNGNPYEVRQDYTTHAESFKAGAEWQKEKEYTCYEEAFEDGAKWKKEKTIDKACKWINENAAKYLVDRFVDSTRVVGIDASITEDFRKDMENE